MKTPIYDFSPGATAALLATRSFVYCDLYTIATAGNGPVLLYATGDVDIAYPGGPGTFSAHGPAFDQARSKAVAHWKVGFDVDTWQVVIAPRPVDPLTGAAYPDTIGALPWLAAARAGALYGAQVDVDRAYLAAWPGWPLAQPVAPVGVVRIFAGQVGTLDIGRSQCVMTVNSHLVLLGASMPRNLVQASCRHTLFDQGCGLAASAFAVAGVAAAGSTAGLVQAPALAPPGGSGTYARGRIVMTSGQNQGFARSVRSFMGGALTLLSPLPYAPAPGDGFNAYPGCDLTQQTCALFGNFPNFGGYPYVPVPETAV